MDRHPEILDRYRTAVLIVDIQEKISAVMLHRQRVIDNTLKLVRACRIMDVPVLITEQYPQGLGPTEPVIAEAMESIAPPVKMTFSCCGIQELLDQLSGKDIEQIVIVGIETHVCVQQTALDLLLRGYQVHVLRDCVSSRKEIDYETALERMRASGVIISTLEAALFELLERAGTPEFKEVAKLVK